MVAHPVFCEPNRDWFAARIEHENTGFIFRHKYFVSPYPVHEAGDLPGWFGFSRNHEGGLMRINGKET
jgi:hypothetical protein